MSHRVVILGCGSSGGVPRVGGDWGACDPVNPLNRRRRCSILVERTGSAGVTTALVDTSPDLREQLLDTRTTSLDGVLITHSHADHTHGIDDVRPLVIKMKRRIDLHTDEATSEALRARFSYIYLLIVFSALAFLPSSKQLPISNKHGRKLLLQHTLAS